MADAGEGAHHVIERRDGRTHSAQFAPLFGGQIHGPALRHFQEVEKVWPSFWLFILFFIGLAEASRASIGWNPDLGSSEKLKPSYYPGNLSFDPLNLMPKNSVALRDMQAKELNNGRLAMLGTKPLPPAGTCPSLLTRTHPSTAISGFVAQEEVNHLTIWQEMGRRGWPIPGAEAVTFQ